MKRQLLRYWWAMNATAVQSAAHAGKAWLATAAGHTVSATIPALDMKQFGAVLAIYFGLAILDWLDKNPLPYVPVATPPASTTIK
jgi:hypothetical protein